MESPPHICFDIDGFLIFLITLRQSFGSAGEAMVFQMSRKYGHHLIESVNQLYSSQDNIEYKEALGKQMGRVQSLGWGKMEYEKMNWINGEFTICLNENAFTEQCINGMDTICYFIKGVMTGTLEEITKESYKIELIECPKIGGSKCVYHLNRVN